MNEISKTNILLWNKLDDYLFLEEPHEYYWKDKKVKISVTQLVSSYFQKFDTETISKAYAIKNNLNQDDVKAEWKRKGLISSITGTICHTYLENIKRRKILSVDYDEAIKNNIEKEVKEKVNILLPLLYKYHKDTLNKIYPLQEEFTIGIEDKVAGNIDLIVWNEKFQQIEIWDYKFIKELSYQNKYQKGLDELKAYDDCNFIHYSLQLNLYKEIIERELGLQIGACRLVTFNITQNKYEIISCLDLQKEAKQILNKL